MSELGVALRSERQKKNVTLADVSAATRIKLEFLEALEEGAYHLLPGPAYVTGFLRNYARYLGLHPDDCIQEYYAEQPAVPTPHVKAATRVLATGYERESRRRLFWIMGAIVLLFAGAFAVKQYNDAYGHPYSAPLVTPQNLGSGISTTQIHRAPAAFHVRLKAVAPVWVRVTADGKRVYQGIMRRRDGVHPFSGYHSIFVATYDGAHLMVTMNGHPVGRVANRAGLAVGEATSHGWQQAS